MHELHARRDVGRLDVDLEERHVADPGLVFDLDGVVADPDDEIGAAQKAPLHLPAGPLDAAEGEGMILVDHPLGHGGGGERQGVPFDEALQPRRIGDPHRRRAEHGDRPLRSGDELRGARERDLAGRGKRAHRGRRRYRLLGGRKRDVLRQVEMHRPLRRRERERNRRPQGLADAPLFEAEGPLGDRREQRVVVDPHLDAAPELLGDKIAGERDHRRAVEESAADAGREVGRAGPERRDSEARLAGHPPGDVGGETRRAFMGGEDEIDPALAHRFHQREHVAARNAEAAVDAGRLERRDDQVSIVHVIMPSFAAGHIAFSPSLIERDGDRMGSVQGSASCRSW